MRRTIIFAFLLTCAIFCSARPAAAQSYCEVSACESYAHYDASTGEVFGYSRSFCDCIIILGVSAEMRGPYGTAVISGNEEGFVEVVVTLTHIPQVGGGYGVYGTHYLTDGYVYYPDGYSSFQYAEVPVPEITSISGNLSVVDGGETTLTAMVANGSPLYLNWGYWVNPDAGNDPNPPITYMGSASAYIYPAHWFSDPDTLTPCNNLSSTYHITAYATFNGSIWGSREEALEVYVPAMTGDTKPPRVVGPFPTLYASGGLWRVFDQNPYTRVDPVTTVYLPGQSQFEPKTLAHEGKHYEQWTTGMLSGIIQPTSVWYAVKDLTASTEDELRAKITEEAAALVQYWEYVHEYHYQAAEIEAWAVSDSVSPYYFAGSCYGY